MAGFTFLVFGIVLAHMWASARHALRLEDANSKVLALAETDLLTNLANRRGFLKRLTEAFTASRNGAPQFAVHYIDIDDFKDVNDTLGHPMGDALLQEIVRRLRQAVREEDVVARFGGDEFAILQFNAADQAAVNALATRVVALMATPFDIAGHRFRITASIGLHPDRRADRNCVAARSLGVGGSLPSAQALARSRPSPSGHGGECFRGTA